MDFINAPALLGSGLAKPKPITKAKAKKFICVITHPCYEKIENIMHIRFVRHMRYNKLEFSKS